MMDVVYNKGNSTIIVADNRTTGMTGHQENPGTGKTLMGEEAPQMDIAKIAKAMGVENVIEADPLDVKKMTQIFKEADASDEPTVIVTKRPCALLPGQYWGNYEIDQEKCTQCKACFRIGCPCISENNGEIVIDLVMRAAALEKILIKNNLFSEEEIQEEVKKTYGDLADKARSAMGVED